MWLVIYLVLTQQDSKFHHDQAQQIAIWSSYPLFGIPILEIPTVCQHSRFAGCRVRRRSYSPYKNVFKNELKSIGLVSAWRPHCLGALKVRQPRGAIYSFATKHWFIDMHGITYKVVITWQVWTFFHINIVVREHVPRAIRRTGVRSQAPRTLPGSWNPRSPTYGTPDLQLDSACVKCVFGNGKLSVLR